MKIYKLIKDGLVVYVGRTRLNLSRRKSSGFYNISRSFINQCSIELIEETDDKGRERYWIDYYIEQGFSLLNKRGGDYTNNTDCYEDRKTKQKEKRGFKSMTKEEKLDKRRTYYQKNKDKQNEMRRLKYAEGDSWYHRKQSRNFLI